jgi:glutaminyl-tRNA synthetase
VAELRCSHDPKTLGAAPQGRKVKGTIHWVSADQAQEATIRLYDRLFHTSQPGGDDFLDQLNADSLAVIEGALVEPAIAHDQPGTRYQFERTGYFISDARDSKAGALVFNRIVTLRDAWAKIAASQQDALNDGRASPALEGTLKTPLAESGPTARQRPSKRSREEVRDRVRANHPELAARLPRYVGELGLAEDDAKILTGDLELMHFFEDAIEAHGQPRPVANWVIHEVLRATKDRPISSLPFHGAALGELVALVDAGSITGRAATMVFEEMLETGERPGGIVARRQLAPLDDVDQLGATIDAILAEQADAVRRYRAGNDKLLGFFVGQAMKRTKGRASAELLGRLFQDKLR